MTLMLSDFKKQNEDLTEEVAELHRRLYAKDGADRFSRSVQTKIKMKNKSEQCDLEVLKMEDQGQIADQTTENYTDVQSTTYGMTVKGQQQPAQ